MEYMTLKFVYLILGISFPLMAMGLVNRNRLLMVSAGVLILLLGISLQVNGLAETVCVAQDNQTTEINLANNCFDVVLSDFNDSFYAGHGLVLMLLGLGAILLGLFLD